MVVWFLRTTERTLPTWMLVARFAYTERESRRTDATPSNRSRIRLLSFAPLGQLLSGSFFLP
jgi:hypothetical protein